MTYAGLKSMIYAGLTRDDPRVKAALNYITQHYTLDENPGLGPTGALLLLPHLRQDDDRAGRAEDSPTRRASSHDWRAELVAALAKRQQPEGSWVNPADRFMEGDPNLVTAYALLAWLTRGRRRSERGYGQPFADDKSGGTAKNLLPLPVGEGWGEGQASPRADASGIGESISFEDRFRGPPLCAVR